MDITKEEILMFEKAVEIQKKWKVNEGDCCIERVKYSNNPCVGYIDSDQCTSDNNERKDWRKYNIWLPTQDDLWKMIDGFFGCSSGSSTADIMNLGTKLGSYINKTREFAYWMSFESKKQVLLAFVMHELYHKKWNGKDWIKI